VLGRRTVWSGGLPKPINFTGKNGVTLDILGAGGAQGQTPDRDGLGKVAEIKDNDFLKLGGSAAGKLRAGKDAVTVVAETAHRRHEA